MIEKLIKFDHEILNKNIFNLDSEKIIEVITLKTNKKIYEEYTIDEADYLIKLKKTYEIFLVNKELNLKFETFTNTISNFIKEKKFKSTEYREFDEINNFFKKYNKKIEISIFEAFISLFIIQTLLKRANSIKGKKVYTYGTSDTIINGIEEQLLKLLTWIEYKFDTNTIFTKKHKFIFRIISLLTQKELLFGSNEQIKCERGFKTEKIIKLNMSTTECDFYELNIGLVKNNVISIKGKMHVCNNHFTSIYHIFKKNITNDEIFEFKDVSYIQKLAENGLMIDWTIYKTLLDETLLFHSVDKKNIESDIKKIINNIAKTKNKNTIAKNSQLLSTFLTLKNLIHFEEFSFMKDNKIYFPFSFDFRGRFYLNSPVSPTNSKIIRLCIHYGYYTEEELLENSTSKTNEILNKYIKKIEEIIEKQNWGIKNNNVKISLIWLFINIVKWKKSKISKEINIEKFIDEGYEIYLKLQNNRKKLLNESGLEDFWEILQINYIINNISNKNWIRSAITKDATASVYQHLIKICGENSNESLKFCNLLSLDTWYDTYAIIIEEFKTKYKIDYIFFDKYFNRITLKKTIMTENYSSTFSTCFTDFKEKINWENISIEEQENIKTIYKKFYKFLSENNNELFFKTPTKNIITKSLKIKKEKISLNDGYFSLYYNKLIDGTEEVNISGIRHTKKILKKSSEIDIKKIKSASKANIAQSADAELSRKLNYNWSHFIVSIHDCFLIDYLKTSKFIDRTNISMQESAFIEKEFFNIANKNIYSIFVLL